MDASIRTEAGSERFYSLDGLLSEGIPAVRVEQGVLAELAALPACRKPLYLAGRQEQGYDLITRMVEAPERCAPGERLMGRVAFGPEARKGQRLMPLERLLSQYEDMGDAPTEIVAADGEKGLGYLMLGDGLAVKGPLSDLQECGRRASRFRLSYGYAASYDPESCLFSLGIACRSAHSGEEMLVLRHPWDAVAGSACGGGFAGRQQQEGEEKEEDEGAAKEKKVRPREAGGGYLARMEGYRSTLARRDLSTGERGLLETLVDALTGRARNAGKRAWRWEERVRLLEDLLAGAADGEEKGERGESGRCAEAIAGLERIAASHRYLRRRHPELARRVLAQLGRGAAVL